MELIPHRSPSVLIIHSMVRHYRAPFFDRLYEVLHLEGISLRLVFGLPTGDELLKSDIFPFQREWAARVDNKWFFNDKLLYQSVWNEVRAADLVIVEQANKHFVNYLLLLFRLISYKKVAFWGHGCNRQADARSAGERFKRLLLTAPDWWFAYTSGVTGYLVEQGVRPKIITTVQNSNDTASLQQDLERVSTEGIEALRQLHGLEPEAVIGLYCGSLYPDKQVEFLIDASRLIRAQIVDFHLVVIGGGPQSSLIEAAAAKADWIHFVGPRFGLEKAAYFRLASFFLNPGMVGLSILDAFCAGLPMLTTDYFGHSPEIDYLEPGINGLRSAFEPEAYADSVVELCTDLTLRDSLCKGALMSGQQYSIETMVMNFRDGIMRCLAS
ncbi:MAG: glycosyltransferase family 4 protein [Desulfuromonadales bacterium]